MKCKICGSDKHWTVDGETIYCGNPTPGSVSNKCFYHPARQEMSAIRSAGKRGEIILIQAENRITDVSLALKIIKSDYLDKEDYRWARRRLLRDTRYINLIAN